MDGGAVVTRTEKGEEEIRTRSHHLPKELRFVLILVDGNSTVEALQRKGPGWEVEQRVVELARQGFVTIDGVSPAIFESSIEAVRAQLIRIAEEVLGPDASKIMEKLKASPDTREGLLEAVAQCKKVVRLLIDEEKAERLESRCRGVLAVI